MGLSTPLGMEVAVCACASVIGASENLPCIAPASAAPAAPARPAVRSKVRRSVVEPPPSCSTVIDLVRSFQFPPRLCPEQCLDFKNHFRHASSSATLLSSDKNKTADARAARWVCSRSDKSARATAGIADHRLSRQRQDHAAQSPAAPRRHERQRRHHQRVRRGQPRSSAGRARRWRGRRARERLYLLHNPQRSGGDAAHAAGEAAIAARCRRFAVFWSRPRVSQTPPRSCSCC